MAPSMEIAMSIEYPDYDRAIFRVLPTILAENMSIDIGEYGDFLFTMRSIRRYFGEADITIVAIFDALAPSTMTGKFHRFWRENDGIELSSIYPTLTAPAMISIYTGLPPEIHGIPSTKVYIGEIGNYIDSIRGKTLSSSIPLTKAGVRLESFLWEKPILSLLNEDTIACDILPYGIIGGLRDFYGEYLKPLGYDGFLDAIYIADRLIDYIISKNRMGLIFLYFSTMDTFGHDHGIDIHGWREINDMAYDISQKLINLVENKNRRIAIYFISDHGFMPIDRWIEINDDTLDALGEMGVELAARSGRFMSLFLRENTDPAEVIEDIRPIFRGESDVVDIRECSKKFWPLLDREEEFYQRIGDILVIPRRGVDFHRVSTTETEDEPLDEFVREREKLKANHGGPTKEELSALFIGHTNF